jgi:hypothetical protein
MIRAAVAGPVASANCDGTARLCSAAAARRLGPSGCMIEYEYVRCMLTHDQHGMQTSECKHVAVASGSREVITLAQPMLAARLHSAMPDS